MTIFLAKIMVFNFSLTQKLSLFFLLPEGQLCFWNFSFLADERSIYFGRVQETVGVQSDCSIYKLYIDIQPEKRKAAVFFFLKHGWDTSLDSKSENKYRSDLYFGDSRACLFLSASGNFICLSSHDKILAESFQFHGKENIFYKLEKHIQPDCMTTNQPSQTELSKCHDREKRSFTQLTTPEMP